MRILITDKHYQGDIDVEKAAAGPDAKTDGETLDVVREVRAIPTVYQRSDRGTEQTLPRSGETAVPARFQQTLHSTDVTAHRRRRPSTDERRT